MRPLRGLWRPHTGDQRNTAVAPTTLSGMRSCAIPTARNRGMRGCTGTLQNSYAEIPQLDGLETWYVEPWCGAGRGNSSRDRESLNRLCRSCPYRKPDQRSLDQERCPTEAVD